MKGAWISTVSLLLGCVGAAPTVDTDPAALSGDKVEHRLSLERSRAFGAAAMLGGEGRHACALYGAGQVMCWGGSNASGQLGNGTEEPQHSAVLVSGIDTATAVAVGDAFSCALLAGGTVACWGKNSDGQLGNGGTASSKPVVVSGLSGATGIAAGSRHACARLGGGTVKCWGANERGQLGDGTTTSSAAPVFAQGVAGATSVAAGAFHTCARLASSKVECWGDNAVGQLGDGTARSSSMAIAVPGLVSVDEVAAGAFHTCARLADSTARCWGFNVAGQLGDETRRHSKVPVAVAGLSGVRALAAGTAHTCARLDDGVACWGSNIVGQLGRGDGGDSSVPVRASGVTGASEIFAGDWFTCARSGAAGAIACWGSNAAGQIQPGAGPGVERMPLLVQRRTLSTVRGLALGAAHTCAIVDAAGRVRCWGDNASGQLGDGTTESAPAPVEIFGLGGVTDLAAGAGHTCAVLDDASVRCWGDNRRGQLGDGTKLDRLAPVRVEGLPAATQAAAGERHTCARLADSTARCWGDNGDGQLGDGTLEGSRAPVPVAGLSTVTAIAAGRRHTCALLADATVACWGRNDHGQLGDGTTTASPQPVAVADLEGVSAIAAGGEHTCALLTSGTVRCWGDGGATSSSSPVAVASISTARAVAAGARHACALLRNESVHCWGDGSRGQLGDGKLDVSATPEAVSGLPAGFAIAQLAAGGDHTCARQSDGTIVCWGDGSSGQIGNGHRASYPEPTVLDCAAMDVARSEEPQVFYTSHMPDEGLNGQEAILDLHRVRPVLPPGCSPAFAVILIHGRANESVSTFDNIYSKLPDRSTMRDLAMAGIDAWSLNLSGYGRSKLVDANDPMASPCNASLPWCTPPPPNTVCGPGVTCCAPGPTCDGAVRCSQFDCVPVPGVCDCPGTQDTGCPSMGQQERTLVPNPLAAPCAHRGGGRAYARTENHADDIGLAVARVTAETGLKPSILGQAYSAIPLGYWLGYDDPNDPDVGEPGAIHRNLVDKVIFNAPSFGPAIPATENPASQQATYSMNTRTYALTLELFTVNMVPPVGCYADSEREVLAEALFVSLKERDDVTSADPVWGPQLDNDPARSGTYRIPTNTRYGWTAAEAKAIDNATLVLYGVRDTGSIGTSTSVYNALRLGKTDEQKNKILLRSVACSSHLGWLERCDPELVGGTCLGWPGPHASYSRIVEDFVEKGEVYSTPGVR